MNAPAVVWTVLAAVVAVLLVLGARFSRRVLRVAALLVGFAAALAVTVWGSVDGEVTFSEAVEAGLTKVADAFFRPFFLAYPQPGPDRATWVVLVVVLLVGYWALEAWSARFEPPTVEVVDSEEKDGEEPRLVREVKFRLPAVEVRRPGLLPGAGTTENVAAVVEKSEVPQSAFLSALVKVLGALWPSPPGYRVKIRVEEVPRHVTVDVRDARTDQSRVVRTLTCRSKENLAERVAGFAARTVFADDPTAPAWSVGSFDGEDLTAYLISRQLVVSPSTPCDSTRMRKHQADVLDRAVRASPGAGIVRYELAQLRDLQGRHLEALRLHTVNRVQYPRFLRGRYRFATSLGMVVGDDRYWRRAGTWWPGLVRGLRTRGLSLGFSEHLVDADLPRLRYALLDLAEQELCFYRRAMGFWRLLLRCLRHRDERASARPYLLPLRRGHLRRQRLRQGVEVAEALVRVRQWVLRAAEARHGDSRWKRWSARRYRGKIVRQAARYDPTRWNGSWSAAYNGACLHSAIARGLEDEVLGTPLDRGTEVASVVELLRIAVDDRDCELERAYDWINVDPDLDPIRKEPEFEDFLRAQRERDYPGTG